MNFRTIIFLSILQFASSLHAHPKIRVPVGAYLFAPYYELQDGKPIGLTVETVEILNKLQSDYEFRISEINPQRRYQLFEEKQIELMLFEDPAWQWHKVEHFSIPLGIEDHEVYFALSSKSDQPGYFDNLKERRLVGLLGYHYRFADMNADENYLKKTFQIHLVNSYEASVLFVLSNRADVGLATRSYLHRYFQEHPETKDKIRISDKPDHRFSLKVILSKKSQISKSRMQALVEKLSKDPEYQKSLAKYGLKKEP